MTVPVVPDGALGLYSAVGDAFAGRRLGFGVRRAALALVEQRYLLPEDVPLAVEIAAERYDSFMGAQ